MGVPSPLNGLPRTAALVPSPLEALILTAGVPSPLDVLILAAGAPSPLDTLALIAGAPSPLEFLLRAAGPPSPLDALALVGMPPPTPLFCSSCKAVPSCLLVCITPSEDSRGSLVAITGAECRGPGAPAGGTPAASCALPQEALPGGRALMGSSSGGAVAAVVSCCSLRSMTPVGSRAALPYKVFVGKAYHYGGDVDSTRPSVWLVVTTTLLSSANSYLLKPAHHLNCYLVSQTRQSSLPCW